MNHVEKGMMKSINIKVFLIAFLLIGQSAAFAQNKFPSQIFHKGNIYGTDGQVYSGQVKYDLVNNLVQIQDQAITTFTASNVSNFEIFDEALGGVRKFFSLPYSLNGDYETPIFFEVLTEGDNIALLCREYIATDSRNMGAMNSMGMNPFWGPPTMIGYRLAFNYYFFKDGSIEKYSLKKKGLF
ncbi:MAG: hypothetical protein ACI942_003430, partial [Planctomycetota bacterium]